MPEMFLLLITKDDPIVKNLRVLTVFLRSSQNLKDHKYWKIFFLFKVAE